MTLEKYSRGLDNSGNIEGNVHADVRLHPAG
jgi:hypothetical protein